MPIEPEIDPMRGADVEECPDMRADKKMRYHGVMLRRKKMACAPEVGVRARGFESWQSRTARFRSTALREVVVDRPTFSALAQQLPARSS